MSQDQDLSQDAPETFEESVAPARRSDLAQTLLTIPLLAASAGATLMMLPGKAAVSNNVATVNTVQSNSEFAYDNHKLQDRRQRVVIARMEKLRTQSALDGASQ